MAAAASPSSTKALSAASICAFLLDIHERSNELRYHELHRFTLQRLATVLPFDYGLVAMGTIQNGVPHGHDVVLHERPPEFMESWEEIKAEDRGRSPRLREPRQDGERRRRGTDLRRLRAGAKALS